MLRASFNGDRGSLTCLASVSSCRIYLDIKGLSKSFWRNAVTNSGSFMPIPLCWRSITVVLKGKDKIRKLVSRRSHSILVNSIDNDRQSQLRALLCLSKQLCVNEMILEPVYATVITMRTPFHWILSAAQSYHDHRNVAKHLPSPSSSIKIFSWSPSMASMSPSLTLAMREVMSCRM